MSSYKVRNGIAAVISEVVLICGGRFWQRHKTKDPRVHCTLSSQPTNYIKAALM